MMALFLVKGIGGRASEGWQMQITDKHNLSKAHHVRGNQSINNCISTIDENPLP